MIHYKILGFSLCLMLLVACAPDTNPEKFPDENTTSSDCAADGIGCKQFNKELKM